jgi:fibronectin type 3 domain-containing protein
MQMLRTVRGRWLAMWLQDRRRVRAATHLGPSVPNAPVNLNLSDGSNYITLTWTDMSNDELGFHVYRSVQGGGFALWAILGANVTTTQDNSVILGHVYAYYVTAYNAVGESAPSNTASEPFGA